MSQRPRNLSVETLESRLNLSTLTGLAVPPTAEQVILAQERALAHRTSIESLENAAWNTQADELAEQAGSSAGSSIADDATTQ